MRALYRQLWRKLEEIMVRSAQKTGWLRKLRLITLDNSARSPFLRRGNHNENFSMSFTVGLIIGAINKALMNQLPLISP